MSVRKSGFRILILSTGLGVGGAEAQVKLTARSLAARGWKVEIISLIAAAGSAAELECAGIPVHSLQLAPGKPNPLGLVRLVLHIRRFRPHVLHCHMVHANLLGRLARLFSPIPVLVSTAHSVWEGPRWRDWAYRFTDPLSDVTSNVSRAGLLRYVQQQLIPTDKAIWVPNGVDLSGLAPAHRDRNALRERFQWQSRFVWLAVGNLREAKDYPNLLAAFRPLALSSSKPLLAVAGSGPLEAELRRLAANMGISHAIVFLGSRTDVPELLAAADAFVISSSWEGTPMALLEAAAAALPIVATRVGGNPEAIEDGVSGLLVPAKDSARLSEALKAVMEMAVSSRSEMGNAARRRIETNYQLERVVDKWENIYEQLLQVSEDHSRSLSPLGAFRARLQRIWR